MTSLSILPEELLEKFFSHLHLSGEEVDIDQDKLRKYTLLSLSTTCRTFHRIAQCALYHTISSTFLTHSRFAKLLGTLKSDQQLCSLIKYLKFTAHEDHLWNAFGVSMVPVDYVYTETYFDRIFEDQLSPASLNPTPPNHHKVVDTSIAFLLRICTNIESLAYTQIPNGHTCIVSEIIKRTSQAHSPLETPDWSDPDFRLPPYQSLKEITFNGRNEGMELLLNAPGLEVFNGKVTGSWRDFSRVPLQEVCSSVRVLNLRDFDLLPRDFDTLLKSCPVLEDLSVCWWNHKNSVEFCPGWSQIGDSLRHHGRRLRRCELDTRADSRWSRYKVALRYLAGTRIGDLSSLSFLEHLAVPYDAFWGWHPDDMSRDDFEHYEPESCASMAVGEPNLLTHTLPTSLRSVFIMYTKYKCHFKLQLQALLEDNLFRTLDLVRHEGESLLRVRNDDHGHAQARQSWKSIVRSPHLPTRLTPHTTRTKQNAEYLESIQGRRRRILH